jgi:hypothetical protein
MAPVYRERREREEQERKKREKEEERVREAEARWRRQIAETAEKYGLPMGDEEAPAPQPARGAVQGVPLPGIGMGAIPTPGPGPVAQVPVAGIGAAGVPMATPGGPRPEVGSDEHLRDMMLLEMGRPGGPETQNIIALKGAIPEEKRPPVTLGGTLGTEVAEITGQTTRTAEDWQTVGNILATTQPLWDPKKEEPTFNFPADSAAGELMLKYIGKNKDLKEEDLRLFESMMDRIHLTEGEEKARNAQVGMWEAQADYYTAMAQDVLTRPPKGGKDPQERAFNLFAKKITLQGHWNALSTQLNTIFRWLWDDDNQVYRKPNDREQKRIDKIQGMLAKIEAEDGRLDSMLSQIQGVNLAEIARQALSGMFDTPGTPTNAPASAPGAGLPTTPPQAFQRVP